MSAIGWVLKILLCIFGIALVFSFGFFALLFAPGIILIYGGYCLGGFTGGIMIIFGAVILYIVYFFIRAL
jgi:hypothetical protein